MRLWSLHPQYLDSKGLVAWWREALLAQTVLQGRTKGYRHHPQLTRFWSASNPVAAIATYLVAIQREASRRNYQFDFSKIATGRIHTKIPVTTGQVIYEFNHLQAKLQHRDVKALTSLQTIHFPETHPLFKVIEGPIAPWEITK